MADEEPGDEPDYSHAERMDFDGVLIIGSGPLGSTYARVLVDSGVRVKMIDIGAQLSPNPGTHLKNSVFFQREVNQFVGVIQGHLQPISIPSDHRDNPNLDPYAFQFDVDKYKGYVLGAQNPNQSSYYNLSDAASCYAVGGMATHWTCCTPREHPEIERSDILSNEEWNELYTFAEQNLLKTSQKVFENSIRNTVVKRRLQQEYRELQSDETKPQNLPLAAVGPNNGFITWTGTDTILGEEILTMVKKQDTSLFELCPEWQCWKLVRDPDNAGKIELAVIQDLKKNKLYNCHAKAFVVACNATLTPQLLYNSGIQPPALGKYICEQPITFCQIVMGRDLIEEIENDPKFKTRVEAHKKAHPNDPIPIPFDDLQPQCWIPVSKNHEWHCQISRDAFSYGKVPPNIDPRLIVDLRSFGRVTPDPKNRITFSDEKRDVFGMPQPTYHFKMKPEDEKRSHLMMADMLRQASALGGFLPGVYPQFLNPGLALHLTGSTRMGKDGDDEDTYVVDSYCCVKGFNNLYIGSCGVIPTGTACNTTLTAMALAIRGARQMASKFKSYSVADLTALLYSHQ